MSEGTLDDLLDDVDSMEEFQAEFGTLVVFHGPGKATWIALKRSIGLEGLFKWLYVLGAFFGMKWILTHYTYTITNGINGPIVKDALTGTQETLLALVFVFVLIFMRKYGWKIIEEAKDNAE